MANETHRSGKGGCAVELLTFNLGDQVFCVDIVAVRELRNWTEPTALPHGPAYLAGVINLRGTILPVLDLATRLGLPPLVTEARHVIIVVEAAGQMAGLIVNSVSDIHAVAQDQLEPCPPQSRDGTEVCVAALTLIGDRMFRVLDLSAILPGSAQDTT